MVPGTKDPTEGTRDQGLGTRDQGPVTADQRPGPVTRGQGPVTRDQGTKLVCSGQRSQQGRLISGTDLTENEARVFGSAFLAGALVLVKT